MEVGEGFLQAFAEGTLAPSGAGRGLWRCRGQRRAGSSCGMWLKDNSDFEPVTEDLFTHSA